MADWDDVRRIASLLPETVERVHGHGGGQSFRVRDKAFVWERELRRADLEALGADAPRGPIVGVRTDGPAGKEAALARLAPACFTTPHFDGYPAVLVQLDLVAADDLRELVVDAWLARAPKRLATEFLNREK